MAATTCLHRCRSGLVPRRPALIADAPAARLVPARTAACPNACLAAVARAVPNRVLHPAARALAFALLRVLLWLAGGSAHAELRLLAAELPPYTYQVPSASVSEQPGPGRGVIHALVAELARRVGHSGRIEYLPWFRAQEIARAEPNIGILALTRSPEREPHYRWLIELLRDDLVLVGSPGVDVSDLARVRDRPVGVLAQSGAEALLRSLGFTRIAPQREEWMNARRIKERRIDAWLAPRLMIGHAVREVQGNLDVLQFGQIVRPSGLYLATSRDLPEAEAQRWLAAFEAMRADGAYQRIVQQNLAARVDPVDDQKRRIREEPFN